MSNRQKSILIFLSFCLVVVLITFSILVLRDRTSILSATTQNSNDTPQIVDEEVSDLEIFAALTQQPPLSQTTFALDPTQEIGSLPLPLPASTEAAEYTDIPTEMTPTTKAVPCPTNVSGGLVTVVREVTANMPQPGSNGFIQPTDDQIAGWESLINAIIADEVLEACSIINAYRFPYELVNFTDTFNENQQYLMLLENTPIQFGWGTYVFRTGKKTSPLVVEVPHPIADWNTEIEGAEIFRKTNAQALLIAGTHRCANDEYSACTGETIACGQVEPYHISDVGHGVQNMFHVTHRILVECRTKTVAIQLHGNSLSNCPDIFVSNGTVKPGEITKDLSKAVTSSCRDYSVDMANGEAGECTFTGGGSPQAVLTNSCRWSNPPDACTGYALRPSGPDQFLSIEQSVDIRKDFDCVIDALNDVFNP